MSMWLIGRCIVRSLVVPTFIGVWFCSCDAFKVSVCNDNSQTLGCIDYPSMMQVTPSRIHYGLMDKDPLLRVQIMDLEAIQLIRQGMLPQLALRQGGDPPIALTDGQRAGDDVLVSVPKSALGLLSYGPLDLLATINGRQLHAAMRFYQDLQWMTPLNVEISGVKPQYLVYWFSPERGSMSRAAIFRSAGPDQNSRLRWSSARCSFSLAANPQRISIMDSTCDIPSMLLNSYATLPSEDCDLGATASSFFVRCVETKISNDAYLARFLMPPLMDIAKPLEYVFPSAPEPTTPSDLKWDSSQMTADQTGDLVVLQDKDYLRYFVKVAGSTTSKGEVSLSSLPSSPALVVGDLDGAIGAEIVMLTKPSEGITATIHSVPNNTGFVVTLNEDLTAGLTVSLRNWLKNNNSPALSSSTSRIQLALNDFDRDGLPDLMIAGIQEKNLLLTLVSYIGNNEFEITEQKISDFFATTGVTIKSISSGTVQNDKNIDLVVNSIDNKNKPYVRVLLGNGK